MVPDGVPPSLPPRMQGWKLRLVWRTVYVCLVVFIAILMPFFSYVVGFVGAVGFWPGELEAAGGCGDTRQRVPQRVHRRGV